MHHPDLQFYRMIRPLPYRYLSMRCRSALAGLFLAWRLLPDSPFPVRIRPVGPGRQKVFHVRRNRLWTLAESRLLAPSRLHSRKVKLEGPSDHSHRCSRIDETHEPNLAYPKRDYEVRVSSGSRTPGVEWLPGGFRSAQQ